MLRCWAAAALIGFDAVVEVLLPVGSTGGSASTSARGTRAWTEVISSKSSSLDDSVSLRNQRNPITTTWIAKTMPRIFRKKPFIECKQA